MVTFLNEIGRIISQTTGVYAVAPSAVSVKIQRSDGSGFTKTGADVVVDDEMTGQVHWTSESGDLSVVGEYMMQVKFEFGANIIYGPLTSFEVEGVL